MSAEELNDLAAALGELRPSSAVDRDRLMFEAGRAIRPTAWCWPLATIASSLAALGLGAVLLFRPAPAPITRTIYVHLEAPVPAAPVQPAPEPGPTGPPAGQAAWPDFPYYRIQEQLSRWGFDAVPPPTHAEPDQTPEPVDGLLNSFGVETAPKK